MFYTPVALKQSYITYVHCQFLKSKHMNYIRNQQSPDNREQKKKPCNNVCNRRKRDNRSWLFNCVKRLLKWLFSNGAQISNEFPYTRRRNNFHTNQLLNVQHTNSEMFYKITCCVTVNILKHPSQIRMFQHDFSFG